MCLFRLTDVGSHSLLIRRDHILQSVCSATQLRSGARSQSPIQPSPHSARVSFLSRSLGCEPATRRGQPSTTTIMASSSSYPKKVRVVLTKYIHRFSSSSDLYTFAEEPRLLPSLADTQATTAPPQRPKVPISSPSLRRSGSSWTGMSVSSFPRAKSRGSARLTRSRVRSS